ncbi:RNA polymerase sporulation sigma factor SigK [Oscillospiraceae bacterium Marseille-Q3528]|nr:RNA polymerase sporulation sigma factor SigK [Oscillospiraceae bacterium Marseille-Q3528]
MKTFPKPLTTEEEKEYLKRYRKGDQTARNVLIERNLRLVAHIVKKYQSSGEDTEDLISVGTIGLIKAVMTFDAAKGSRLATYAARCIDNELLMMFRARKKSARDVSLYEPIGTDREGNEISLLDVIEYADPEIPEKIDLKDNIVYLYEVMHQILTARERQVLTMRYGLYGRQSVTQRETAAILGISRSYVSRIEKTAVQKLQKAFEKSGRSER